MKANYILASMTGIATVEFTMYGYLVKYKTNEIESFEKEVLLKIKSDLGVDSFTLATNAGGDIHSSELKNGSWKGIKFEKIS